MARPSLQSPGVLDELLRSLADEGFAVGASEAIKAHTLVSEGRARRDDEWKFALAPVFARDANAQRRFYEVYDRFAGTAFQLRGLPGLTGVPPSAETPADLGGRRSARIGWLIAVSALLVGLGWPQLVGPRLAVSVTTPSSPAERPPGPPPPAATSPAQSPPPAVMTIDLPCDGIDCITGTRWGWLLISPVATWILVSFILKAPIRRADVYRRERLMTPPYVWPLGGGRTFPRSGDAIGAILQMIRRRPTGDAHRLDVKRSIRATVRKAGCPVLHFEEERRAPEYLFVIQQRHRHDHFAAWVASLVRVMRRNGVEARACFYEHDPRLLRLEDSRRPLRLRELADASSGTRAVFVGDASSWLDPLSRQPGEWTRVVAGGWVERVLLTPTHDRGAVEERLLRVLPVRPFTMWQLAKLADLFEAPLLAVRDDAVSGGFELPLPPGHVLEQPTDGRDALLRLFFPPAVFRWLCACAVHSELEWEWTIALADVVAPAGALLNEQNLLSLIRLPWFREGHIPDAWRPVLIAALPPDVLMRVREALLRRLESDSAPRGTFAYGKQTLDIAAQKYWLDPTSGSRARLERAMSMVAAADVHADRLLVETAGRWSMAPGWPGTSLGWARFLASRGPIKFAVVASLTIAIALFLNEGSRQIQTTVPPSSANRPAFKQSIPPPSEGSITPPPPAAPRQDTPRRSTGRTTPVTQPPAPTAPGPVAGAGGIVPTPDPGNVAPGPVEQAAGRPLAAPDLPPSVSGLDITQFSPLPPVVPPQSSAAPSAPAVPAELDAAKRQVFSYGSASNAKGSLVITVLTGTNYPLPNLTDVTIVSAGKTVFDMPNIRFDRYLSGAIEITGVPDGDYRVEVDPSGVAAQRSTVTIRGGAAQPINIVARDVEIDLKDVKAVFWPSYDRLPEKLRSKLEASDSVTGFPGLSGRQLYDRLDAVRCASLLNLYAKASNVRLGVGPRTAWDYLTAVSEVQSDRLLAAADLALSDALGSSAGFSAVASSLHAAPAGFATVASFRTREAAATLQMTMFRAVAGDARQLVDLDIDLSTGLAKTFGIIGRALTRRTVHPYAVQQALIATLRIDPGYRLITNPDLAKAVPTPPRP